ncbi:MolR family transcriptional regulator [Chitinophaga sp. SYP-B3965]|uniref:MolR family transcriptional regulator n=1 Tax=Chitinophaga sp. SYP-B3965 TaxID=2663120 RepID=UPI00129961A7|nr:MolR family transcriptional regulator [Chitinophaga sp. SYP-B3965]MRG47650.1 MolR family transcriptional regulator [Chitinophaga sp. SYP-B3965]
MPDFYFDDPEGAGPARETSHPAFVRIIKEDFYYDCMDEFSPFGNDDGADTLFNLQDWYEEHGNLQDPEKFLKDLIEGALGMDTQHLRLTDRNQIIKIHGNEVFLFNTIDNVIIATAFGQYKIEGRLDASLRELAQIALERQKVITQYQIDNDELSLEQGGVDPLFLTYLARLEKMHEDLQLLK